MKARLLSVVGAGVGIALVATVIAQERRSSEAAPGIHHQELNALIGDWQATGQCFKAGPQGEAISGTSKTEWVMGNRFILCKARWTEGGKNVEGLGLSGYDTNEKKFVTSWADTNSTGINTEFGEYNPGTQTFTYNGEFKGENGQTMRCRKTMKVTSDNEHTITGYVTEPGKPEMKVVELNFKRAD